jgi:hypothetical protein
MQFKIFITFQKIVKLDKEFINGLFARRFTEHGLFQVLKRVYTK